MVNINSKVIISSTLPTIQYNEETCRDEMMHYKRIDNKLYVSADLWELIKNKGYILAEEWEK